MALHAVVFRNLDSLPARVRDRVRVADSATGELEWISFEPSELDSKVCFVAINISIGNLSLIRWLANEISLRWGSKCRTLMETFLYSGSHAGDVVEINQITLIRREIEQMNLATYELPKDLLGFFKSVDQLTNTAERERNPIVFV